MADLTNAYVGWTEGNKQGGMWGGIGGALDGYFGGPIFKAHMKRLKDWYTYPQLDKLNLSSPTVGLDKYLEQVPYAERLNTVLGVLNSRDNAGYQKTISSLDPNLTRNVGQLGKNTGAYLRGEIPADVLSQLYRSNAYKSFMGGFGGSRMASARGARDFGLTSLDLMDRGRASLKDSYALNLALNPYNKQAQDMFTSPQDLLQRDDRMVTYNNSIANQQKALDFASHIATSGGDPGLLTSTIGGMYGGGANRTPVYNSSGQQQQGGGGMDMATIMKLFGASGGGGGGLAASGTAGANWGG